MRAAVNPGAARMAAETKPGKCMLGIAVFVDTSFVLDLMRERRRGNTGAATLVQS